MFYGGGYFVDLFPSICERELYRGKFISLGFVEGKEIHHHVGLSCEGFEKEFMALLTTVEVNHL